jgi:putative hemolysin
MHSTMLRCVAEPAYRVRLATGESDLHAAQRLRFEVFNLELNEGLAASWSTHRDVDQFDDACDHLLVEQTATNAIVGTYRLQTGMMASLHHGYYSAQEFDFSPFEPHRTELVELGRACVHQEHRRMNVLNLLWRGIAEYARWRGARYLVGCSSLTSQDPALGHTMYAKLAERHLVADEFRTVPIGAYALPEVPPLQECPEPPRLLRAYLAIGARICGPAAIDREFGTIDFLTLLDLNDLPAVVHNRYLGS